MLRNRASRAAVALGAAGVLLAVTAAPAAGRPTRRLSATAAGQANGASGVGAAVAIGGGAVAFVSAATNLVLPWAAVAAAPPRTHGRLAAGQLLPMPDTNGAPDVLVHDLRTGLIERVSTGPAGLEANGPSGEPSLSGDGRLVAFSSDATNLAGLRIGPLELGAGDGNAATDVFVHDRLTGLTLLVSGAAVGGAGNGASRRPSIAAGGRWVAFESDATDLTATPDTNGVTDVFVHDLLLGETERVGGGPGTEPSISADGQRIAFTSAAALVPGDTNGAPDVYLADRDTGRIELVSQTLADPARAGNGPSAGPALSDDGFTVAFASAASDLVASDGNGLMDVFVRDLATGVTRRAAGGSDPNGPSSEPSLSPDGTAVAFSSSATNFGHESGAAGARQIFVFRPEDGSITLMSQSDGAPGGGESFAPAAGPFGLVVAYGSHAALDPGDDNGLSDVYATFDEERCPAGQENGPVSGTVHGAEPPGLAGSLAHHISCTVLVPLAL